MDKENKEILKECLAWIDKEINRDLLKDFLILGMLATISVAMVFL